MLHVMRTSLKDLRSALRQVVCWMLVSKDCSDPEELVLRSVNYPCKSHEKLPLAGTISKFLEVEALVYCSVLQESSTLA